MTFLINFRNPAVQEAMKRAYRHDTDFSNPAVTRLSNSSFAVRSSSGRFIYHVNYTVSRNGTLCGRCDCEAQVVCWHLGITARSAQARLCQPADNAAVVARGMRAISDLFGEMAVIA